MSQQERETEAASETETETETGSGAGSEAGSEAGSGDGAEVQSDHTTRTSDGGVEIDIEDAGGRELRDVDEQPPDDEVQEIEAERELRLDGDNRPENAEVDNTHRDFDSAAGKFTDSDDYDASDQPYAPADDSGDSEDSGDSNDSDDDEAGAGG
jgi:hypothetical protein